ncbi:hypothetical protein [Ruegeria arenilitoris]|uniref:hypothetical protein n=1 Tax=Ruegeria arenilitoris TaxID=1173585 RepID=UPI001479EA6C|nr:hypothetical protein [Ruegeria arenilitoris]
MQLRFRNKILREARRNYPLNSEAQKIEISIVDASEWQAALAKEPAVTLSSYGVPKLIFQSPPLELSAAETLARRQVETS